MPHVHIGLAHALVIYLSWLVVHVLVQMAALQFPDSHIAKAVAVFG